MSLLIEDNSLVLFQGDSITDAGRIKSDPNSLGIGYSMIAASWLSALMPEKQLRFLNRGMSGNRAIGLKRRWMEDCIELKPDWVSIMIGINDTWRRFDSNDPTSVESYEESLHFILEQTSEMLGALIILVEPFVLPHPADRTEWRNDLDPKIEVVHKLAAGFDAIVVNMDKIFAEAIKVQPPEYWAPDGVHPTPAGHGLIAQSWLEAVGLDNK